jgi:hypothetical protein
VQDDYFCRVIEPDLEDANLITISKETALHTMREMMKEYVALALRKRAGVKEREHEKVKAREAKAAQRQQKIESKAVLFYINAFKPKRTKLSKLKPAELDDLYAKVHSELQKEQNVSLTREQFDAQVAKERNKRSDASILRKSVSGKREGSMKKKKQENSASRFVERIRRSLGIDRKLLKEQIHQDRLLAAAMQRKMKWSREELTHAIKENY